MSYSLDELTRLVSEQTFKIDKKLFDLRHRRELALRLEQEMKVLEADIKEMESFLELLELQRRTEEDKIIEIGLATIGRSAPLRRRKK